MSQRRGTQSDSEINKAMARVTTTPYAITHANGSVTILRAVDAHGARGVGQFVAASASTNPVTDVVKIEHKDVPRDTSYRNAWTFDGNAFGHDMTKARDLHRDKLRAARAPMLAALDVEFMRTLEAGGDTKAIAAEKQRLRDCPADLRISAAASIDDLKTAWPL